jgi:phytoene dehydrogenase-like protein
MKGETIVVGGGLGGLAAAAYLARAGQRVRVLEKSTHLGGRARSRRHDVEGGRFTFNLGPHALYRKGPAELALRELGVAIDGAMPGASGALAFARGQTFMLPAGPFSLLATGLLPAGAKLQVARLLASLQRLDVAALVGVNVARWLDGLGLDAEARALIEALVRVSSYTHAPHLLDASAAISQLQRVSKHNVLYLNHGWQPLVDGLERAAIAAGVEIEGGAKATKLVVEGGRVRFVEVENGRRFEANSVILAASPSVASALLPSASELALVASRAVPIEAACLDVGLSRLPRPRHNFLLGVDVPYYASVHSAVADVAPLHAATIHVARYLAPGESAPNEAELFAVLERLQPGASDVVVTKSFFPKLTVMHDVVSAARGGYAGRPSVAVAGVANAALIGDWVGAEGLLADATFASARAAASLFGAFDKASEVRATA